MAKRFRKSRLQKIEEKKSLKQAVFFFFLTAFLIFAVFLVGLPLAVKLAVYLGEIRSPEKYSESSQLLPPTQPRLRPLPQATNSAKLSLVGFSAAGTKIKVFLNNTLIEETMANKEGDFNVKGLNLKKGENEIKVTALSNDQESEPYISKVLYKKTPPSLEIESPENNAAFFDEDKEILVKGKTDPGSVILVNKHLAIVDNQGNFETKLPLEEGENQIIISAQDEAGNQTEMERKVTYTP